MRNEARNTSDLQFNGDLLVGNFLAAMTNRVAAETASVVAEQTEHETLQNIVSAGTAPGGGYLMPRTVPADLQEMLVRSSVDAHIKKVQAVQVNDLANNQLVQMQAENEAAYLGRKVQISIIDQSSQPVESYWFDSQTGQEQIGIIKKASVKGIIRTIALDKNLLIIQPTVGSRLFNPARKYFLIHVINPQTMAPAVRIILL